MEICMAISLIAARIVLVVERLQSRAMIGLAIGGAFGDTSSMNKLAFRSKVACLAAACFLGTAGVRASIPGVQDDAKLFSPTAVQQAESSIRDIQREFRKDLLIETFPGIPDARTNDYAR